MKLSLRLLTILCYFLPFTFFFTTCGNGIELRIAYNKAEADKNILLEKESTKAATETVLVDTTKLDTAMKKAWEETMKDTVNTPSDTLQSSPDFVVKILRPTDTSLSGIGSIFYFKNLTGKIAIAISLLISLVLLVAFKFLQSQRAKLYLLFTAVVCLAIFMTDSFISSVTLLWGSWTLLILLLLQLILEFNNKTKNFG
jgi:hypothetical protein